MSTMGYVTTLTGAEDAAGLSLDFEKQIYRVSEGGNLANKNFSDILTFVRASRAGRFNEKGLYEVVNNNQPRIDFDPVTKKSRGLLVERSTTNQTTYYDTFTNNTWLKTSGSIELVGGSPFGKSYKYMASASASPHFLQKTYNSLPIGTYAATRVLKAGEHTKVRAQIYGTSAYAAADFDLAAGTVVSTAGLASITPIGDGWYLTTITATTTVAESITDRWYPLKGTDALFVGNGVDGYYIAASQFESNVCPTSIVPSNEIFDSRSSTATYFDSKGILKVAGVNVPRSSAYIYDQNNKIVPVGLLLESAAATNRIRMSSDFNSAPWNKNNVAVISSDGGMAPDGTVAQRFKILGTTAHNINQPLDSALLTTSSYTLSVWLRSVTWGTTSFQMAYYDSGTNVNQASVYPTKEWKRFTFTFTPASVAVSPQIRLVGYSQGADGEMFEMWGAQLEVGDTATSYIPTTANFTSRASTATYFDSAGVMKTAEVNAARADAYKYDVDGVLRPVGLLIEAAATNIILSSQAFNNSNWTKNKVGSSPEPIVVDNVEIAPDGTTTAASLTINTPTATDAASIVSRAFVTTVGKEYLHTIYLKAKNAGDVGRTLIVRAASVSLTVTLTDKWKRYEVSEVATTSSGALAVRSGVTLGVVECAIWGAQVEIGGTSSSYIPTTTSATTRAADIFTSFQSTRAADVSTSSQTTRVAEYVYNNTLPLWFDQAKGTAFVLGQHRTGSDFPNKHIFNFQANAVQDWMALRNAAGILQVGSGNTSGSATMIMPGLAVTDGAVFKAALRYKNNDSALSINSLAVQKDVTCLFPAVVPYTRLVLGSYNQGNETMNGWIKSFSYYKADLADSQLQIITS